MNKKNLRIILLIIISVYYIYTEVVDPSLSYTPSYNIEEIPEGCFQYVYIEKLRLPSNLKHIRCAAFVGLSFDEVILPKGIETVESWSLSGHYEKIHIPKSIKSLAEDFYYEDGIDNDYEEHKPIIIKYWNASE